MLVNARSALGLQNLLVDIRNSMGMYILFRHELNIKCDLNGLRGKAPHRPIPLWQWQRLFLFVVENSCKAATYDGLKRFVSGGIGVISEHKRRG